MRHDVCKNRQRGPQPVLVLALPVSACLVAAILFGASTPLTKTIVRSVGPFTLAGLLYLGGALATLPGAFRGGSPALRRDRRQLRMLVLAVVFGGGLGPVFLLMGLRTAPASSVALWLNLETVATVLLAWGFFSEHLDRRTVLAASLVLFGGVLLALSEPAAGLRSGALVALACICWGLDNNLTALVSGFTPAQTTAIKGIGAGATNLMLGLLFEGWSPTARTVVGAMGIGAFGYGVSIMLYIWGAQQLGASRSQLVFSTSPVAGALLAWLALGEPVRAMQIVSAAAMTVGILVLLAARHEHEHAHEEMFHTHSHRHDDGHHVHVHVGLPASIRHTHPHLHEPLAHLHPHTPDLHHRHRH
jgi:drug/metabolite transporter (DMT)-like permease